MRKYRYSLPAICALAVLPAAAEDVDSGAEWDTVRCINSRVVRGTDVIDDRNIVFRMTGRKIYLNTLPSPCRGLSRERRFSYVVHTSSLCERDHIRILEDSGFGLHEGRACRLGRFRPVTEDDLEYWIKSQRKEPEPEPVEPSAIEDLGEAADVDADDDVSDGDQQGGAAGESHDD